MLISIALTAMMNLVVISKKLLFDAQDYTKANSLTQEGIEMAKHQRDIGCSFSNIKTFIDAGSNRFVIKSDTDATTDESIREFADNGSKVPNQIDGFNGFERNIYAYDMGSDGFSTGAFSSIASGFQNDGNCNTAADYDCRDKYYYVRVEVTWTSQDGSSKKLSTAGIISKETPE